MPVDIRATVSCSLGTVISGSVSDEYVQGTGLIKCRGTVLINGIITPAVGTAVTFTYTKSGITRSIPRKLRVLSSFADPFRRTTSVELGCKLTYLSDKRDSIDWTAFNDANNTLTADDAKIITIPIRAQAVAKKCMDELGITGAFTLTNQFSVDKFDLSPGYVQVLSDLLVSESLCGYLDANEALQVFSLDQAGGTGPVLDATQLVDIAKIGVGDLPGEAVVVSYSTLKLKRDVASDEDSVERRNWERSESIGRPTTVFVSNPFFKKNPFPYSVPEFFEYNYIPRSVTITSYDAWDRVVKRTTTVYSILAEVAPSYIAHRAGSGSIPGLVAPGSGLTPYQYKKETTIEYELTAAPAADKPQEYANVKKETTRTYEPYVKLAGSTPIYQLAGANNIHFDWRLGASNVFQASITETTYETTYDQDGAQISKTITNETTCYAYTQRGQQYVNSAFNETVLFESVGNSLVSNGVAESILDRAAVLVPQGSAEEIQVGREINLQRRPNDADRTNALGARAESKSELALALGSATAQRRIELSLPYAPDDFFVKNGSTYSSVASDAPQKAQKYGIVQNRLLLGNRNGMNIQCAPEVLPAAPFAPFVVRSGSTSALYRTNGTSWTFDAQGLVVSTDALFWGGVGGNAGESWFPVAPGVTTLPTTPGTTTVNITDANGNVVGSYEQIVVDNTVPVYQETRLLQSTLRVRPVVTAMAFAMQEMAEVAITTKVKMVVRRLTAISVPAAAITVSGAAPTVSTGARVIVPTSTMELAALAPVVAINTVVNVPTAGIAVAGLVPQLVGRQRTQVLVPPADITMTGLTPLVATGTAVAVPTVGITVAGIVPAQFGGVKDPEWASVSLLLRMDGSNGSVTFTDLSTNAHAITVFGNAQVSTADPKFGTGALTLDGDGDYLRTPADADFSFGTGNLTVECWCKPDIVSGNDGLFTFGDLFVALFQGNWYLGTTGSGGSNMGSATAGSWQHVAVTRTGSNLRLFINGTQKGSTLTDSTNLTGNQLIIGYYFGTIYAFDGLIDEFRVTKGVSRYTSNFTAPTAPFPAA